MLGETKEQKRARKLAAKAARGRLLTADQYDSGAVELTPQHGLKLQRFTVCTKPGHDGCVNTEGSEHADAGWMHWCPACEHMHAIAVEFPFSNGAKWTFDGNLDKPTFSPSVKIQWHVRKDYHCCHYFIRAGMIEFCGDCTHSLSGKTVPLPPIPRQEL